MLHLVDGIRRRAVVSAAIAVLFAGTAMGISGCTNANAMDETAMDEDALDFILVAVDSAPQTGEVKPLLILSGHGSFTADSVIADGKYTLADAATEVPKMILSTGRWSATEVIGWTPAEGGATYGQIHPGTVDLRVNLIPNEGPVIEGAILRVNCNVGLADIVNKAPDTGETLAEGYWLTVPAGASFGGIAGLGPFAPKDPILGVTEITG